MVALANGIEDDTMVSLTKVVGAGEETPWDWPAATEVVEAVLLPTEVGVVLFMERALVGSGSTKDVAVTLTPFDESDRPGGVETVPFDEEGVLVGIGPGNDVAVKDDESFAGVEGPEDGKMVTLEGERVTIGEVGDSVKFVVGNGGSSVTVINGGEVPVLDATGEPIRVVVLNRMLASVAVPLTMTDEATPMIE